MIIVSFENDKVVALDSFASPYIPATPVSVDPASVTPVSVEPIYVDPLEPGCIRRMRSADFMHFYEKVKLKAFKDDQFEMMAAVADKHSLSCRQCARLMSLFSFDDDKMKVLYLFASNIYGKEHYDVIIDKLDSVFKQNEAKKILGIRW